jgi:hypothetical protein
LISQHSDGKNTTSKSIEILTSKVADHIAINLKERLRTQRKSSDFLYYEPSIKKNPSMEQEQRKTPKDKGLLPRKKSELPTQKNLMISRDNQINNFIQKKEAKSQILPMQKIKKYDSDNSKAIKSVEMMIDEYRDVLHHSFRYLSSHDPNFAKNAFLQDQDIEKKTGIVLKGLTSMDLKNMNQREYENSEPFFYSHNENSRKSNQMNLASPSINTNISTPPNFMLLGRDVSSKMANPQPKMVELNSPIIMQPIAVSGGPSTLSPFQPVAIKPRQSEPKITEFKNSPQIKTFKQSSPNQHSNETQLLSNY